MSEILKDSAASGNGFVNGYVVSLLGDKDHMDEIFEVKTTKGETVQQRVIVKKMKNGWKIWASELGNPESRSGKTVIMDMREYQRYAANPDLMKQKAISENFNLSKMIRRIIKEEMNSNKGTHDNPFVDKKGVKYFAEKDGSHWIVVSQYRNGPPTEAFDSLFRNEKDAIAIALLISQGKDPNEI